MKNLPDFSRLDVSFSILGIDLIAASHLTKQSKVIKITVRCPKQPLLCLLIAIVIELLAAFENFFVVKIISAKRRHFFFKIHITLFFP